MYAIILGFITAFTLTFSIIPVIIRVARERRIYDRPNERSSHEEPTPSLGGIGIFAGTICAVVLWTPLDSFSVLQYILAAFVLIFLIGALDDLLPLSPYKKFSAQLLVAVILAYKADVRISSLYGVFGVYDLPELTSFVLSVLVIIAIINSFNLIDGINGLAGSIGLLACVSLGMWFWAIHSPALAVVAFSLAGAITAFLKYNFTPAQIFMGDTGSLLIGTVCAILSIHFIEMNHLASVQSARTFHSSPAIAVSILILPLYDTVRVFVQRILQGRSPFSPDKTHIHHIMLDLGCSHTQATAILLAINILFVVFTIMLDWLGTPTLLALDIVLMFLLMFALQQFSRKRKTNEPPLL
ncbi:MAG: undecaprenyl/decaprenyl-phosphate alpha-N-acetylglucosaminyl 1-phosphate transferase [Saprospiraceae bacterium]|nr:undecaprenyl/decaprenyl-phosphate alpha-N-acetylglucosaminyl 1-phosphate transferase [Saprospiraceae bacterium]